MVGSGRFSVKFAYCGQRGKAEKSARFSAPENIVNPLFYSANRGILEWGNLSETGEKT